MLLTLTSAGASLDVIMPGRGGKSLFSELMEDIIAAARPQSVGIYMAPSADELPTVMAKALNSRTGAQALLEQAGREAVHGLDKPVKAMSTLKLRKNVVE